MIFDEFFTQNFSDALYSEISRHDLLRLDSTSFYLLVLSLGTNRQVSPIVEMCIEKNLTNKLIDICLQKNLDRWEKVQTSLSKNYTAFDNEVELITANQTIDTSTTNNFDIYDSLNNSIKVDSKENTITDNVSKTDTLQKSKSNIKDFNVALKNFISSTEFNTDDVIASDIIKLLTLDIY